MPETRKHRVQARDQIDQAIFAALGEPVLPSQPGMAPLHAPTAERSEQGAVTPSATSFATGGTMGAFTFHTHKPTRDADAS